MGKSLAEWKNSVLGRVLKVDDSSADCVDVSKHWIEYLTGVGWQTSAGWGNAKDIYAYWSDKYLTKMPAGSSPQLGDIAVMDGSVGGGYGHTGVVIAITGRNITLAQQNTFTQQAVYTGVWNGYGGYIKYMRPKTAFAEGAAPALGGNQRIVGGYGVMHRDAANRSANIRTIWPGGDILTLGGFVRGENVDGNDIWFVGGISGGYLHSSGFTDIGTHDLPDVTPAKAIEPYQRQVAADAMNYRRTPELVPDNVIKQFAPGEILDFDGFVRGSSVEGNNIWFRGKHTGGFVHSSGFTDIGTHDLPDVTTAAPTPPTPSPTPVPPQADLTAKVIDISSHNKIVDYAAVKAAVRAVITKAGHTGKSYNGTIWNGDPTFAERKTQFGDKLIGAYWYGYASLAAEAEATAFLATVGDVPATFSYWLDIEEMDGQSVDQINKWCQKFLAKVESTIKRKCGVYTSRNFYATVITQETLGGRPVWLAHFDTPEFSNSVTNQVAHQYTSKGAVPGIEGFVDINAVNDQFFIAPPVVTDPTPTPTPVPTPTPTPTPPTKPADPSSDYITSLIRTSVPYIIGLIVSWLASKGLNVPEDIQTQVISTLTVVLGFLYYAIARKLEQLKPKFGLLLGRAKSPVYTTAPKSEK